MGFWMIDYGFKTCKIFVKLKWTDSKAYIILF